MPRRSRRGAAVVVGAGPVLLMVDAPRGGVVVCVRLRLRRR
ncbi:hypothetical protein [Streptomyces lavendulocolor]